MEFHNGRVILHGGDCLDVLDAMPENSVDSICTDPPYHLASIVKRFGGENAAPAKDYTGEKEGATGAYARASRGFMNKVWDGGDVAFRAETWAKVLRVLKPGGHLVAFAATRNSHRMVCAIEDAGFEIRDGLQWLYGSGFPKSLDVSKAIDKAAGAQREVVGVDAVRAAKQTGANGTAAYGDFNGSGGVITAPATDAAREWQGWGTSLKPAYEPICLARKPLSEGTVAANVLRWGTGAINVDACRVGDFVNDTPPGTDRFNKANFENGYRPSAYGRDGEASATRRYADKGGTNFGASPGSRGGSPSGRFPANIVHDGSDEVLAGFPETKSGLLQAHHTRSRDKKQNTYGDWADGPGSNFDGAPSYGDNGSAARFFYSAKADATDRAFSKHPTVKPVALMRWLVRLVTPPGGTVLDVFAGTGTTGHAALLEGFNAILIEREEEYRADIARRMALVFAGEVERAKHAPAETVDALPLFAEPADV